MAQESFDDWLESVDLIAYKDRLIAAGIESTKAFTVSTKEKFEQMIGKHIKLDKPFHIGLFGAAYDLVKTQSGMYDSKQTINQL